MSMDHALLNRRVLITRDDASAKRMAEHVISYGGEPVITPILSFEKIQTEKQQLLETYESNWVVFTSGNGVRFYLESLADYQLDKNRLPNIAVVGEKTERTLQKAGLSAKLVPETFSAQGLASTFETFPIGQKIVLVKGRLAKDSLQKELVKQGHHVTSLTTYDTVPNVSTKPKLKHVLSEGKLDVLTFTSPSSLDFFLELSGLQTQDAFFEKITVACIGPETRQAAIQRGLKNIIMPDRYTADALVEAIAKAFLNQP